MIKDEIKHSFKGIPFKSSLSFKYLITAIERISKTQDHPMHSMAIDVLKDVAAQPEIYRTMPSDTDLTPFKPLISKLMAFPFNPLRDNIDLSTALAPFGQRPFYKTKAFKETIAGPGRQFTITGGLDESSMIPVVAYQAYLIILTKFYNYSFDFDLPFIYKLTDEKDRSVKFYKFIVDADHTEILTNGKIRKLSRKDLKSLFDRANDLDYWNRMIPLNRFEFTGFLQFTFIDITQEHVVSELKSTLLEKESILTDQGFEKIRDLVGVLIGNPDIDFGLAAFNNFESSLNQNVIWRSIVPASELPCEDYVATNYEKAYREQRIVLSDNLAEDDPDPANRALLKMGVRSHAIIPLSLDNTLVGMIEFGAHKPGMMNLIQIQRFHQLFPIFAIALKRSRQELDDRIRAIIQEECTAIHPVVEWRFREAASKMLHETIGGTTPTMEQIIFNDVVPIYGATDIRNSSVERNKAIQGDLTDQLTLILQILEDARKETEMPLLSHLMFKTGKYLKSVKSGLKAGDEVNILEFIRREVEAVFTLLAGRSERIGLKIGDYQSTLDPQLGIVYKRRKDFEESLTEINESIGSLIDEEQVKAQQVFPHYFEKYRTDGVEYNAYIGQSLVRDQVYDEAYLKNIRLWQLLVKIRIAQKINDLKPHLKTQLDITQLILVHANPLSISFRQDEKKFDVAGAYNIRYEITKKRIDKAVVKGTRERVTQVGKIAIIYSHAEEIGEYRKYLDYLIEEKLIDEAVEELSLEDLQGASGLRALRVKVRFDNPVSLEEISIHNVKDVIGSN